MIGLLLCGLAQQATLLAEPEAVRIGEPVTWTLLVEHDVDERVVVADDAVPPDDSWVLLEGPERVRVRDGEVAHAESGACSLSRGASSTPRHRPLERSRLTPRGAVEVAGSSRPTRRAAWCCCWSPGRGEASWTPLLLVAGLIGALSPVSCEDEARGVQAPTWPPRTSPPWRPCSPTASPRWRWLPSSPSACARAWMHSRQHLDRDCSTRSGSARWRTVAGSRRPASRS